MLLHVKVVHELLRVVTFDIVRYAFYVIFQNEYIGSHVFSSVCIYGLLLIAITLFNSGEYSHTCKGLPIVHFKGSQLEFS